MGWPPRPSMLEIAKKALQVGLFVGAVTCSLWAATHDDARRPTTNLVILENRHLRLAFGSQDGSLRSFVPIQSDDNYLKGLVSPPPVFTVTVGNSDGTNQEEALPTSATVSVRGSSALIRVPSLQSHGKILPITATITVQLADQAAESRWTLVLSNRDLTHTIFGAAFPRLYGVRLSSSWENNTLYFPFWGGERFPHAVQDFVDLGEGNLSAIEMGRRRVTKENGDYVHELVYAGGASMMWMDYTDAALGLYLASYDPEFLVTVLHADTRGPASGAMNFELRKWLTIRPGQNWTSAPFIVAAHGGDWHWAADSYRAWFNTQAHVGFDGGSWRRQIGGWLVFMKNAYGRVAYRFQDLPALWEREKKLGMDLLVPYGWSRGGFDSYDPEYYPNLDLGGPWEMASAYHGITKSGGEVMTYLNARIFDKASVYFDTLGKDWAVRNPDGSEIIERYRPGSPESFAVMCPGSQGWRSLLTAFGNTAAAQYDSHIIYYDQVAAARPLACYSPHHGHDQIGRWNSAYRTLLHDTYESARGLDTHVTLMIEGAADLYAPFALFQGSFSPLSTGTRFAFPELYKYTFPEVIQGAFVVNTRNSPNTLYPNIPVLPHDAAVLSLCHDIMVGKLLIFMDPVLDDHAWWDEVQKFLAIRKSAAPWMAMGAYRDTVDVTAAPLSLEVKTFRWDAGKTRSTLIEVLNPERVPGDAITVRCGLLSGLRAFQLKGYGSESDIPFDFASGQVTVRAPSDLLSMIVVEGALK